MNLLKLCFQVSYVVDADNPDMVQHAREAIFEDVIQAAVKDPANFDTYIEMQHADDLTEADIPDFLKDPEGDEG